MLGHVHAAVKIDNYVEMKRRVGTEGRASRETIGIQRATLDIC